MNKKMSIENSAINIEVERIGDAYFSQEKHNGRNRKGKLLRRISGRVITY